MKVTIKKTLLTLAMAAIFISSTAATSYAVLNMSEIQYLFEQENGQSWDNATAKEQRSFINEIKGREEFQEGKFKDLAAPAKGDTSDSGSESSIDDEEEVPFRVKESYEVDTGIEWDNASEEEQKSYLKWYGRQEKRQEREEKRYEKYLERKEKRDLKEFERHKKLVERRAKRREKEKARKLKEVRRKRERSEKEMERAEKELERMRKNFERRSRR